MKPAIAVGIGCRKGCAGDAIAALVRRALASLGSTQPGEAERRQGISLFSSEDKRSEQGLVDAATALDLPLILLPQARLLAAAPRCETRSARVEALFGLPSVAEAAALAGAGENSRLVVKRISEAGASCAVAQPSEIAP
ncbi:cobalt-precorrin 5A hydrolase [Rhizobiales bacterium GAS191]|jgi:cobalt-precorrin 5A hydrolase|nr:cobalt-precorrin 5A hydrolase [Rhizobiales bacterium GAS113]SEC00973.1 cobalt-precorrin 5A hydrolase [Rhizobiales bacterium GAS191]SED17903.1 cobalt-precorrin 5A hydrolase [Rhizobiales bacterium GAS188]